MLISVCTLVRKTVRIPIANLFLLSFCFAVLPFCLPHDLLAAESPRAIVLEIKGAISPAVNDYLRRGMEKAVRITSYNVCYTKLLRVPGARRRMRRAPSTSPKRSCRKAQLR